MAYTNEEIIHALKNGRHAKGLSQRALSAHTGVPQSHISKIESGSTDIRLSSLIELARALDLEVKLVPRKALPAVDSIVRSTAPSVPLSAAKEWQRTLSAVDKLRLTYPDLSALNKLQESLRTISQFKSTDTYLATIKNLTRPLNDLQKYIDQFRQVDRAARLPTEKIKEIEEAANRVQSLRNQFLHTASPALPRPAYRLDENDDEDHEHKELGDA
jgi:transcriptional regulator with XRE-family HTH domain